MDDSGRGFLSFRAHGKIKIFDFSDESSNFKEMYFKISKAPGIQPFYLTSEKKAKFSLYWRMGYRSPQPRANTLSEEEKKADKEHLNLKDLMCDDEIAKRVADALIAMRRRLIAKQQISGDKEASSSATYLMTQEAVEALEGIEVMDNTIRIQRMLLQAAIHCRDVQREVAGIPELQNMLSEKENRIKTLGSRVTELEAKEKSRGAEVLRLKGVEKSLNEKVKAAEKKAIELQASLNKAHEDLASMEKAKVVAEMSALTAMTDIEKTMLEQVSFLAPGIDFSKVSAYNKVVNGHIVEAPSNVLPEVLSSGVPE
ncbi:hypothetical protein PIB30_065182 [Stylosanthes scabra]|uniref:Uncharacterized protein n=1 Tax=Stylosanthes scabra TaxID=79078 RepID=A0ABU6WLV4_9FABA|nr:hypothetical protein [Stylosanthes scabra]